MNASMCGYVEVVKLLLAVPGRDIGYGECEVKKRRKKKRGGKHDVILSNLINLSNLISFFYFSKYCLFGLKRVSVRWMLLVEATGMKWLSCC
jgi:hypothetical protein